MTTEERLQYCQRELARMDAKLETSERRERHLAREMEDQRTRNTLLSISCFAAGFGLGFVLSWVMRGGAV